MYELEDTYWWFIGRRFVLRSLLRRICKTLPPEPEILDVGCGTGANVLLLREFGRVHGVDAHDEALRLCRERGIAEVERGNAEELEFPDQSFDLVTSLEVLEHVEDDFRALREVARVLRVGGRALITVPAYPWLWSEHDEALHHVRRYTRRRLVEAVRGAGLVVERLTHCVACLLPVTVAFRYGQRLVMAVRGPSSRGPRSGLVMVPKALSALFVATLRLEAVALNRLNLPFGVTLVVQARR